MAMSANSQQVLCLCQPSLACMVLGPALKNLAFECLFNDWTTSACLPCFCYSFSIKQNKIKQKNKPLKPYACGKFLKGALLPAIFSTGREETEYLLSINLQKGRYFPLTPLISWLSPESYINGYLDIHLLIEES